MPEDTTSTCSLDVQPSNSKPDEKWHVVVDTNILLHDLNLVTDLRDSLFTGKLFYFCHEIVGFICLYDFQAVEKQT